MRARRAGVVLDWSSSLSRGMSLGVPPALVATVRLPTVLLTLLLPLRFLQVSCVIDCAVYTRNRAFRLYLSSKVCFRGSLFPGRRRCGGLAQAILEHLSTSNNLHPCPRCSRRLGRKRGSFPHSVSAENGSSPAEHGVTKPQRPHKTVWPLLLRQSPAQALRRRQQGPTPPPPRAQPAQQRATRLPRHSQQRNSAVRPTETRRLRQLRSGETRSRRLLKRRRHLAPSSPRTRALMSPAARL